MKTACQYFLFTSNLLIAGVIFHAQAQTTNLPTHPLPTIADINKWRASPLDAVQRGADEGQTDAMIALYMAYGEGRGVPVDCKEAMNWLTKASEAGNPCAQCMLGRCYENPAMQDSGDGLRSPPPNMPEAILWYRRSSEQGWAAGQDRLALCYIRGKGIEQDEEYGLELLRKAADQGQIYALSDLADCYARGIGTPRNDEDRPLQLLTRIASKDPQDNYSKVAEAFDQIICRYEFGVGTRRDILAAAEWYCEAAMKGIAGYTLADKVELDAPKGPPPGGYGLISAERSYIFGVLPNRWDRRDPIYAALSLYLKAVQGDSSAMMQIGGLYLTGDDVPKNPAKAWVWFSFAAQKGAKEAGANISKAALGMSATESGQSEQMLRDLIQKSNRVSAAIR